MMKALKAFALATSALIGSAGAFGAAAAPCVNGTVAAVDLAGPCELRNGTVVFDILDYVLPAGATISFFQNASTNFRIQVSAFVDGSGAGNFHYSLNATTLGGLAGVLLDSDGFNSTVTKRISSESLPNGISLTSVDGDPEPGTNQYVPLGNITILEVFDTFSVTDGSLSSFSNQFLVPEPTTLGLLGLGLIGLGVARRRRASA